MKLFESGEFQKMLNNPTIAAKLVMTDLLAPQLGKIIAAKAKSAAKAEILEKAGQPSKLTASGVHRGAELQENDEFEDELNKLGNLSPQEMQQRRM